ncbi:16S rRNA (uracil(1498)-N(3))-methyltransferase [Rubritalea spongiae]|uniref:Ribosomal RNA small subunit methyltransferase E n=1 Tax=Rubritalea spongiae TaxID=430797 RepID=A0ABW5EA51_9BACT
MNSINRYYLPAEQWSRCELELTGDEAHHCVRVLRQKVGDWVVVFDGEGRSVKCQIVVLEKSRVVLEQDGPLEMQERGLAIHLCQAIPKAGNMELIVQKAVELGVASIQPLATANTVAKANSKKVQKWQRIALEACKQCGQNWLPKVSEVAEINSWLDQREKAELEIVAALDPRSEEMSQVLEGNRDVASASLLVGPEGDFSSNEYDAAIESGFKPVGLGDIVLRVETATLYCLSVLRYTLS